MSSASCCLPFSLRSVLERCHLFCVFMSSALRCGSLLASARSQGDVSALFCLPRPVSTISSTSVLFFALGPALSLRWIICSDVVYVRLLPALIFRSADIAEHPRHSARNGCSLRCAQFPRASCLPLSAHAIPILPDPSHRSAM
jgi:hypothetical protein